MSERRVRRQEGDSSIGSILAVVGCVGVLVGTFALGAYAGRYWTRPATARTTASSDPTDQTSRPAPPTLTFYEELTAPLPGALPPASAKPTPAERRRTEERGERSSPSERREPERRERDESPRPAAHRDRKADGSVARADRPADPSRYTVQVAAYRSKTHAEALRASMIAAGHEAYVVETEAPAGTARYRVRVGSYASREAAAVAAARLKSQGQGATYVTTR